MKVPDTAISNPDFKIDLKNPEKTFTNKQLWDAFVNAQTNLDEAVALLKEYKDCYGTPIGLNERCDEFLREVGEG